MAQPPVCCTHPQKKAWYKNKTFLAAAGLSNLVGLSTILPFLIPFRQALFMYIRVVWWAVLLGLFLGGMMDYLIPRTYVSKVLARRRKRTIGHAVLLGFFMSVCSHGILALAMQLYKKGAATSSVIAFLLASPWANLPLTFMLIGFFGLARALFIVGSAIVIALTTGLIYQGLELRSIVERNPNSLDTAPDFSIMKDVQRRVQNYQLSAQQGWQDLKGMTQGALALSNMVLWWILIGIGCASLAGAYIPEDIFRQYMGPNMPGMMVTLFVATILEVCSEGTAPLAFEIFRRTGAFGNSLVFLMAGVATDATEIGLLWHNVGKRTAIWLPMITVPQIIFWGCLAKLMMVSL